MKTLSTCFAFPDRLSPVKANESLIMPGIARAQGISLRPMEPGDLTFLRDLYVSTRWKELQCVAGWNDHQRRAFLASQADLQHRSYLQNASDTEFGILHCKGKPLGRLYLRRIEDNELRVVDIALLPEWRNRGLGSALLRAVMDRAKSESRFVSMHVVRNNPAQRLYERLGFLLREQKPTHDFLVWKPT